MLRVCHSSLCRFTERTDTSSRMHSCLFSVTYLGGNPTISSPLGHCHLGPRLSCRHVRLETLFRRAGSFCVISIVAIAPSLRSGGAAYCLFAHVRTHAYTRMHTRGGERRGTYTQKGLYADNNLLIMKNKRQEHFCRHLALGAELNSWEVNFSVRFHGSIVGHKPSSVRFFSELRKTDVLGENFKLHWGQFPPLCQWKAAEQAEDFCFNRLDNMV